VRQRVREAIPSEDLSAVDLYLDRALERLSKGAVRHWVKDDEFCLSFEERERLSALATEFAILESRLHDELAGTTAHFASAAAVDLPDDLEGYVATTRRIV